MTKLTIALTKSQISRSKRILPSHLIIYHNLFDTQTSYLVIKYNSIRQISWSRWWWLWLDVKVKNVNNKKTKQWVISRMLFHLHLVLVYLCTTQTFRYHPLKILFQNINLKSESKVYKHVTFDKSKEQQSIASIKSNKLTSSRWTSS